MLIILLTNVSSQFIFKLYKKVFYIPPLAVRITNHSGDAEPKGFFYEVMYE